MRFISAIYRALSVHNTARAIVRGRPVRRLGRIVYGRATGRFANKYIK